MILKFCFRKNITKSFFCFPNCDFSSSIPVIDVSPLYSKNIKAIQDVGRKIDEANKEIGFFLIKNTAIDFEKINEVIEISKDFFKSSLDNKMTCRNDHDPAYLPWGYFPRNYERLQRGKDFENPKNDYLNDVNETFNLQNLNPNSQEPLRQFPPYPLNFKQILEDYYQKAYELSNLMMMGFAAGLEIPLNFFDDKFTYGSSALRLLYYPPGERLNNGQYRTSEHTDYGSLTLLYSTSSGLQVKNRRGEWLDIEVPYENFVVNIGDLMAFWTNDRWVSNLHRVVGKEEIPKERYSVVFFHIPNHDAVIECIPNCADLTTKKGKYEKITSGDFIMRKFKAAVGK